jgi:hypothetical protein
MLFDDMEDNEKGPFCKPFGQLFYDNLQMMPSFQIIEAYLACLIETQDRLNRAISILEATLKKGAERLKELDKPAELQFYYGKITNSKGAIEKEIEHLSQNRRAIDNLITAYSEKGILDMPIKDFMTTFDAEYAIKVEKKKPDSEELYSTTIKATDLAECAGFEHLNKVMTGYLLKKLLKKKEA